MPSVSPSWGMATATTRMKYLYHQFRLNRIGFNQTDSSNGATLTAPEGATTFQNASSERRRGFTLALWEWSAQ